MLTGPNTAIGADGGSTQSRKAAAVKAWLAQISIAPTGGRLLVFPAKQTGGRQLPQLTPAGPVFPVHSLFSTRFRVLLYLNRPGTSLELRYSR